MILYGVDTMIFVTGPRYSNKQKYIMEQLGMTEEEFIQNGIRDAEELVRENIIREEMEELSEKLSKEKRIVIANEVGGGVVPMDPEERAFRERAGRFACLLSEKAERVIRVVCGLGQVLK